MKKMLLGSLLVLASSQAMSAEVVGQVTAITAKMNGPLVKFKLVNENDDVGAACNSSGWFAINSNKTGGERVYQMVMDAYSRNLPITVKAPKNNPCDEEAGVMTVRSVTIGG